MIKSELIRRWAERDPRRTMLEVERTVNTIFDEIAAALARGGRVELRDFGAFSIKKRTARSARNPRTGESVAVEARVHPCFKTGRALYKGLNGGKEEETRE